MPSPSRWSTGSCTTPNPLAEGRQLPPQGPRPRPPPSPPERRNSLTNHPRTPRRGPQSALQRPIFTDHPPKKGASVRLGVKRESPGRQMPCREADFGSRAALRNLRRSLVGALAGRARVAEPCAARQAGLGDVPTLRGPWRLQVFARLTRASAPLKRRSRRPGGRRPSQGRCSFALRFTPKRREDPDKCWGLKRPRPVGRGRVRLMHGFARLAGWRGVFQRARMARVSRSWARIAHPVEVLIPSSPFSLVRRRP
jgi:hypothetical protein